LIVHEARFKKTWLVHPADAVAAQSAIREITARIETAKAKTGKTSLDVEQSNILNNLKEKLKEFSQKNPSEATALLEQLKLRYPTYSWDD
jgi:hypothetical protein